MITLVLFSKLVLMLWFKNGFMRIIYGGVEEGSYLCNHPTVDEIHMTGSDKTFDSIVFGLGAEGAKRKAQRKPLNEKRFTGELGNVSPYIIVPGPWSSRDIAAQGEMLARCLVINSGFNCLTPRVIVQSAGWELRTMLNDAIGAVLKQVETRKAYYPGAAQRMGRFLSEHLGANQYGSAQAGHLPWTYITGLDPDNSEDICFRNEAFCGLFSEVGLEASSVERFLDRAVDFANQTLWGNLTATIIAHPDSLRDKNVGSAIERAVADLRYGMILINQFAGIGFMAQTTTWGAYPGNDIYDIQSGSGVTSNVLMFDDPEKSVVRSPFKIRPDPFALTSRNPVDFAKKLADFQHKPMWWKIPSYLWSAARS
jgi:acyl-CoA reductase-like NAD-dependent aldehyde dehydrogenase